MRAAGVAEAKIQPATPAARPLAFAIAHEVGNHLGGVRLHAHLLDEDQDARSLAETAVVIDQLVGRAGPLLALLRPLLSDDWETGAELLWSDVAARVTRQIEDQGTGGVGFEIALEAPETVAVRGLDWLHPLLIALIESTLAELDRRHRLALTIRSGESAGEVVVVFEDDGPEEDLSTEAAHRGRALCLALARELVGRAGGHVEAARAADRTRMALRFPISDGEA